MVHALWQWRWFIWWRKPFRKPFSQANYISLCIEIALCGTMHAHWMFFLKCFMKTLKDFMTQSARLDKLDWQPCCHYQGGKSHAKPWPLALPSCVAPILLGCNKGPSWHGPNHSYQPSRALLFEPALHLKSQSDDVSTCHTCISVCTSCRNLGLWQHI